MTMRAMTPSTPPLGGLWWSAAVLACAPAWAQTPASTNAPATPPANAAAGSSNNAQASPAAAPGTAAPSGSAPQQVQITGGRTSDTDERRRATAAKIIIGREEIEKFGDATLGEVLRRMPGVTTPGPPGRGGPPRMRGLGGGYTQLLIDGQRIPPGFSLDSLTPEQIERIEILRAPTAETGARAIAGTINIITREGFTRRLNDLRIGAGLEDGKLSPGLNWSRNDTAGTLIYNIAAGLFVARRSALSTTETTDEDLNTAQVSRLQREVASGEDKRHGLNLTGRLQWRLGEGADSLVLMPSIFHSTANNQRLFVLTQSVGSVPAPYDSGHSESDSAFTVARVNLMWRQRLGPGRMELNGGASGWRARSESLREEAGSASTAVLSRSLDDRSQTRQNSLNLTGKYTLLSGGQTPGVNEHSLVFGSEVDAQRREETRTTVQSLNGGAPAPLLQDFGDNLSASSLRVAAYAQDEWAINPNWAVHLGLRWEGIDTKGEAQGSQAAPHNRSSVWTPLMHAVWKPDAKGRDQLRMSLTRSYKSPDLGTLIARPSISSRYPVSGSNVPTAPDRAGNPALRPEQALGLDVALERYLDNGGLLSANVFVRRIQDLNRSVTALEAVSWSPVPRWVARQQNVGNAITRGIELEAKYRINQIVAGARPLDLRANLSIFDSSVQGVPGPDNRLDNQAKATGNVGADYRFRGVPLTVGGNLNWVPGYRTQVSGEQATSVNTKRVWDAFALWTFSPAVGLRLLGSNLAPGDTINSNALTVGTVRETARTVTPSYINWQLRLELKL